MSREALLKDLQDYRPFDEAEGEGLQKIISFLQQNNNCFCRSNLTGHITGSALVVHKDDGRYLLNHHKKLDKWLCFGGHADGDTDVFRVACREAEEESGIQDITAAAAGIFDVDAHEIPFDPRKKEPAHIHYDISYLLYTDSHDFAVSGESHALRWVTAEEAAAMNLDRRQKRMIDKAEKMKGNAHGHTDR